MILAPLALLAAGLPFAPTRAVAAAAQAADAEADAARIGGVFLPDAALQRLVSGAFDVAFAQNMDAPGRNRDFVKHPGMRAYIFAAIRPELERKLMATIPDLRRRFTALLIRDIPAADLHALAEALRTPAIARFIGMAYDNFIDGGEHPEAKDVIVDRFMQSLTPDELHRLDAFGASPAAAQMQVVSRDMEEATKVWRQSLDGMMPDIANRYDALRAQFIAKEKAGHE